MPEKYFSNSVAIFACRSLSATFLAKTDVNSSTNNGTQHGFTEMSQDTSVEHTVVSLLCARCKHGMNFDAFILFIIGVFGMISAVLIFSFVFVLHLCTALVDLACWNKIIILLRSFSHSSAQMFRECIKASLNKLKGDSLSVTLKLCCSSVKL